MVARMPSPYAALETCATQKFANKITQGTEGFEKLQRDQITIRGKLFNLRQPQIGV